MPHVIYVLIFWLSCISFVSFVITVADKLNAKRGTTRIPESLLILFSILGGSLAMFFTMLVIRHKTRHAKFMIGIPIIILIQVVLAFAVFIKFPSFFQ